jgi:hypothetical protein
MFTDRLEKYQKLEESRNSKLLVYITGDRPGLETQIHPEVLDCFVQHLDRFGVVQKISLYIYSRGGETLAAWSIANLIRQFCTDFEVIIPSKAHSAATLICLASNRIIMTKQATIGPIDPSINTPLNPKIEGGPPQARSSVSVEAIKGFFELAKNELGIKNGRELSNILLKLSDQVHPLVLGQVYRARTQIQMLAKRLIVHQTQDKKKIEKIISFLCSESGSHDYTINRREARDALGLTIEKPSDDLYKIIKEIFDDIQKELELTNKYEPLRLLGSSDHVSYSLRRCLLESITSGSHIFISEGELKKRIITMPPGITQVGIEDNRQFEGWRKS